VFPQASRLWPSIPIWPLAPLGPRTRFLSSHLFSAPTFPQPLLFLCPLPPHICLHYLAASTFPLGLHDFFCLPPLFGPLPILGLVTLFGCNVFSGTAFPLASHPCQALCSELAAEEEDEEVSACCHTLVFGSAEFLSFPSRHSRCCFQRDGGAVRVRRLPVPMQATLRVRTATA